MKYLILFLFSCLATQGQSVFLSETEIADNSHYLASEWSSAFGYIAKTTGRCSFEATVFSSATTSFGSICSTIERNQNFPYDQECKQNQLIIVSESLVAIAKSTSIAEDGWTLRMRGISSSSWLERIIHNSSKVAKCCDDSFHNMFIPQGCDDPPSPIVIDMNNNGFIFAGYEDRVLFPIRPQYGETIQSWMKADTDDVFLAIDLNLNNRIDDGGEMFGNGTLLIQEDTYAMNGFEALAQYDLAINGGNEDGLIDSRDAVWSRLILWNDYDADASSNDFELEPISDSPLKAIDLIVEETEKRDMHGNWLRYFTKSIIHRGTELISTSAIDVYFVDYSGEKY